MSKILTKDDGTFDYDDTGVVDPAKMDDPMAAVLDAIMGPMFTQNLNASVEKGEFTKAEADSIASCFNAKGGRAAISLVQELHPELFPAE